MEKFTLQEKYPVYSFKVSKNDTTFTNVDEIIDYLKGKIDGHPVAKFLTVFDHYSHTKELENGEIDENIVNAKNIIFCFGIKIPNPDVMAVRPRSIGVTELKDHFVINYMEAPMLPANQAMEEWVTSIRNK